MNSSSINYDTWAKKIIRDVIRTTEAYDEGDYSVLSKFIYIGREARRIFVGTDYDISREVETKP